MTRRSLFTEEELLSLASKYGFVYEPDSSKCKSGYDGKVMFITFYVKDGVVDYGEPGFGATSPYEKEWVLSYTPVKHVHDVYINLFDQEDQNKLNDWNKNYHGHVRVKVVGHTLFTDEELIRT